MNLDEFRATTVRLGARSYPVLVGEGLLGIINETIIQYLPDVTGCVIVTSTVVDQLFGDKVSSSLSRLGAAKVLLPDGEIAKTWGWAGRLIGSFLDIGLDRNGVVVALGGGTIGDLAGFAASVYLRGIRVVQVPTTLLGQVDSSIGGKTAVNHSKGKNLIGAFHQPSLVLCDTTVLRTLPQREIRSGFGEVVKYGVINDSSFFSLVEAKGKRLLSVDATELRTIVTKCASIKALYVEQDERDDSGVRAGLNYGHTVGHAIETTTHGETNHGEAVAVGMMVASRLATELGLLKESEFERQKTLLNELGLQTQPPRVEPSRLIKVMRRDKKAKAGEIRFVLPTGIGKPPVIRSVPEANIKRALEV